MPALRRTLTLFALALALLASLAVAPDLPAADAATGSVAERAVAVAAAQRGKPYVYGAAGPNAFDCSGLTQYAYRAAGVSLPRTALGQYLATRHVSFRAVRLGDLVFMASSGASSDWRLIDHVGIYAGNGNWWVARHPGTTVTLQHLWTANVWVGRVAG